MKLLVKSGIYNWYFAKYSTSSNIIWEQIYISISSSNTLAGILDAAITADSEFICTGYDGGEHRTIKTNALGVSGAIYMEPQAVNHLALLLLLCPIKVVMLF